MADALTTTEAADLDRLEAIIRSGLDTFYEVGGALAEIAERKLHRQTHETFAEYCEGVWGIGRARGYQLIAAAKIVSEMSTKVDTALLPKTEREARELLPVPAEKRPEVMQEAAKLSAPRPPSAKDVAKAAAPYVPMAERRERAEKRAAAKAKKESKLDALRAQREAQYESKTPAPPRTTEPETHTEPPAPRTPAAYAVREAIRGAGVILTDPTPEDRPGLTPADREWFRSVSRWAQLWSAACPAEKPAAA